ncbi:MAG: hypothetical protein ACWA5P_01990 [bacterium]
MINRVKKLVQILINTDGRGNFKIDDFNEILYLVIQEIFEGWMYELNRALRREYRGQINNDLENLPDRIREKLLYYLTESTITLTDGSGDLPSDMRYLDTLYSGDREVENCKNTKEFNVIKSLQLTSPNSDYPIAVKKGTTISVLPNTITELTCNYLRNPIAPKWTYSLVGGVELFNPAANDFQDIDMHPSEEEHIVRRVCRHMGLHLKEGDVQNAMNRLEEVEQIEENRA